MVGREHDAVRRRLTQRAKERDVSLRSLSLKVLGKNSGYLSDFIDGSPVELDHDERVLLEDYLDLPRDTLKPSTYKKPVHKLQKGIDPQPSDDAQFPTGVIKVEQVDIRAGLGGGGEVDSENETVGGGYTVSKDAVIATWGVPDIYLRELGTRRDGVFLFRVQGDSMEKPDGSGIHSGDIVLADTNDKRPSPPGIFAVWDGLGTIVKRIEYIMNSEPARVKIRSDNPNHDSYERTLEEVNIIGRCVWYGRRL